MKITYKFSNNNGTYLCFGEMEYEEDFQKFLSGISRTLGIVEPQSRQSPYSVTAEFNWLNSNLIAMFHEDTGCCIIVPNESSEVIKRLEEIFV